MKERQERGSRSRRRKTDRPATSIIAVLHVGNRPIHRPSLPPSLSRDFTLRKAALLSCAARALVVERTGVAHCVCPAWLLLSSWCSLWLGGSLVCSLLGRSFVLVCFYEPFGRWPDGSLPSVLDGEGGWGKRPRACGEAPLFLAFGFGGSIDRSGFAMRCSSTKIYACGGRCVGVVVGAFFFFLRGRRRRSERRE